MSTCARLILPTRNTGFRMRKIHPKQRPSHMAKFRVVMPAFAVAARSGTRWPFRCGPAGRSLWPDGCRDFLGDQLAFTSMLSSGHSPMLAAPRWCRHSANALGEAAGRLDRWPSSRHSLLEALDGASMQFRSDCKRGSSLRHRNPLLLISLPDEIRRSTACRLAAQAMKRARTERALNPQCLVLALVATTIKPLASPLFLMMRSSMGCASSTCRGLRTDHRSLRSR